jgi:hypothetical protein
VVRIRGVNNEHTQSAFRWSCGLLFPSKILSLSIFVGDNNACDYTIRRDDYFVNYCPWKF